MYTTDIAIDKVPLIEYYGFTDEQNQIIRNLLKTFWLCLKSATIVIKRDKDFDYDKVAVLFRECIQGLTRNSQSSEVYMATLTFLAKCSEAGLYYR